MYFDAIRMMAQLWIQAQRLKPPSDDRKRHLNHLDRQRKTAKMVDQLTLSRR